MAEIIEEQLKARGFEPVGKSGMYLKKTKSVKGEEGVLKVNVKAKVAMFATDNDAFETYSDVPELGEIQELLHGKPETMGQKLKEAMDQRQAGGKVATPETPAPSPASTVPAVQAQQNKPAVKKDFVVGAFDGLPETLVMKMGDKPYVTKAGLNFVGKKLGITVKVEPVRYSFEKHPDGMKIAIFKGTATDAEGREYVDYGIASVENTTQMIVKGGNLDHMASTRASNRALRLATACGYCSIEELPEPPRHVIDAEFTDA